MHPVMLSIFMLYQAVYPKRDQKKKVIGGRFQGAFLAVGDILPVVSLFS
jgi:hypothetical protein